MSISPLKRKSDETESGDLREGRACRRRMIGGVPEDWGAVDLTQWAMAVMSNLVLDAPPELPQNFAKYVLDGKRDSNNAKALPKMGDVLLKKFGLRKATDRARFQAALVALDEPNMAPTEPKLIPVAKKVALVESNRAVSNNRSSNGGGNDSSGSSGSSNSSRSSSSSSSSSNASISLVGLLLFLFLAYGFQMYHTARDNQILAQVRQQRATCFGGCQSKTPAVAITAVGGKWRENQRTRGHVRLARPHSFISESDLVPYVHRVPLLAPVYRATTCLCAGISNSTSCRVLPFREILLSRSYSLAFFSYGRGNG